MTQVEESTAENDFLLHAARVGVGTESFVPEMLAGVSDWEKVFRLGVQHAMTPLVCHALSPLIAGEVPVGAATLRQVALRRILLRNAQLVGALNEILALFESNGISAIPFKGPLLAFQLYGETSLRSSVDLDFLVRAKDLRHVMNLLLSQGYHTTCPSEPAQQAAYLRVRHDLHFGRDGTCSIELHQALLPPFSQFRYDYDGLWARLRRVRFGDCDVLLMAPEDLLLALCAHGTKHIWGRLGWICDIARLLLRFDREISWSLIDELAISLGARRMVLLGAYLARELLNVPLPEAIRPCVESDTTVPRLASRICEPWNLGTARSVGILGEHLFFLQTRERFRDRVAYCAHLMVYPTEQDYAALPLPRMLDGLYYPLHAFRVTALVAAAWFNRRLQR